MHYKLKAVKDGENEYKTRGYKLFEDESRYYSVWMRNGVPDPATWASELPYYPFERDIPIFTREYCEHEGYNRDTYDTVEII